MASSPTSVRRRAEALVRQRMEAVRSADVTTIMPHHHQHADQHNETQALWNSKDDDGNGDDETTGPTFFWNAKTGTLTEVGGSPSPPQPIAVTSTTVNETQLYPPSVLLHLRPGCKATPDVCSMLPTFRVVSTDISTPPPPRKPTKRGKRLKT